MANVRFASNVLQAFTCGPCACKDDAVPAHSDLAARLQTLVDHMFDQVLEADERAELLVWIREWEAANPDVDNAHRITGWIDVAYAFQARESAADEIRRPARRSDWSLARGLLLPAPA
jgi:hypothetical protein